MKSVDGRTTKGLRIRAQVKDRILTAYVDLLREGVAMPTARQTAVRAGLSVRVIFKHFADLSLLRSAAIGGIEALSKTFYRKLPAQGLAPDAALREFIRQQTNLFETVAPVRRAAASVENIDPVVATVMTRVRATAVQELAIALRPALQLLAPKQRQELLVALHTVCAWPSWETLRSHHRLSVTAARRILERIALSVLHDTIHDT
jgi:TetR/AcrR family transcriptional regulator, regulator of autoinduction and epiphytic fitness